MKVDNRLRTSKLKIINRELPKVKALYAKEDYLPYKREYKKSIIFWQKELKKISK